MIRTLVISLYGIAIALGPLTLPADDVQPRVASSADLSLACRSMKSSFELGEPLVLACVCQNLKQEPLRSGVDLDEHRGLVKITIQEPDGRQHQFRSKLNVTHVISSVRYDPGESRERLFQLEWNATTREPAFSQVGAYRVSISVSVRLDLVGDAIESPVILVNVVQPSDESREVITRIGSLSKVRSLIEDGPQQYCQEAKLSVRNCAEDLVTTGTRLAESGYSPYLVRWALTMYGRIDLFDKGGTPGGGSTSTRRTDIARSAEIGQEFFARWDEHPIASLVTRDMIEVYSRMADGQRASEMVRRYKSRYPNRTSELGPYLEMAKAIGSEAADEAEAP